MENKEKDQGYHRYLTFIGAPFVLVVAPLVGYFFGHWLDHYFQTDPYLSFFFLFVGFIAGTREFYGLIKKI